MQPAIPVIGYVSSESVDDDYKNFSAPFLEGVQETGYFVGQNLKLNVCELRDHVCVRSERGGDA
jgi:hypothetical protein